MHIVRANAFRPRLLPTDSLCILPAHPGQARMAEPFNLSVVLRPPDGPPQETLA